MMMLKKYKAVIYDWDGCLVQSLSVWVDAYKVILKRAGITVNTTDVMSILGNWEAPAMLGHPDLEQANTDIVAYVNEHITDAKLYPNARQAVEYLKNEQGLSVYIVSANRRAIVEGIEAYKDIKPLIDFAVFADGVKKHKPDPEAVNLILNKFGHNKDEVLLIGDSANDVRAAQNAGITSVWFAYPSNKDFHSFEKIATLDPTIQIKDHLDIYTNYMRTARAY